MRVECKLMAGVVVLYNTHSRRGKFDLELHATDSTSMAYDVADWVQTMKHHLLFNSWSTFCSAIAHPCQILHDQLAGLSLASPTFTADL